MIGLRACNLSIGVIVALTGTAVSATENTFDCTIEPSRVAQIGSPAEGIIDVVKVDRGDLVTRGQVLAVLESRTEELAVELARIKAKEDVEVRTTQARLGFQRAEKARAKALFDKQILSDKLLDEARVQEQIARLDVESSSLRHALAKVEYEVAQAQLARRTLRSSISGVVTEVSKMPGEHIHEQVPLLTVAKIDELHVEVYLPVAAYRLVAVGHQARVQPVEPIGGSYPARVTVVDRVFDAASGTFGVRLELPNPEARLPAGIRCTVVFEGIAPSGQDLAEADGDKGTR